MTMTGRDRPSRQATHDGGFTLLELLIAVSLLSLLAVLMGGGLRFGARVWDKGGTLAESSTQLMVAQRFVRRQIAEALPLKDPEKDRSKDIVFSGERNSLRLVTGRLADAHQGGPFLVELALAREDGQRKLIVSWRELNPDLGDLSDRKPMAQSTLMENVRGIEFAYFGHRDGGDTNEWHDRWDKREELPLLVRLRLDGAASSGNQWPDLVAATRIRGVGLR